MLLGYDYGFAMSYESGKNWLHVDNVSMTQLYAIGVDMDYPYNVYGGMKDFGSWKGPSTKKRAFSYPVRGLGAGHGWTRICLQARPAG